MAEESWCKNCGNRVCADFKEEEEHSNKLASLLDPMRTRIYHHEEVCVCVCVFVCVCVRVCVCVTHAHTHAHAHTHVCVWMSICIHIYTYR